MPRIRQFEEKYRKQDFEGTCRAQMARMGLDERRLAAMIDMSHTTLNRRLKAPGELKVDELVKLVAALELGTEDVLGLVGMLGLKVVGNAKRKMRSAE